MRGLKHTQRRQCDPRHQSHSNNADPREGIKTFHEAVWRQGHSIYSNNADPREGIKTPIAAVPRAAINSFDSNNADPREGIKTKATHRVAARNRCNSNNADPREGIKTDTDPSLPAIFESIQITLILVRGLKLARSNAVRFSIYSFK